MPPKTQEALFSDFEAQVNPPSEKLLDRAESLSGFWESFDDDSFVVGLRLSLANNNETRKNSESKLQQKIAAAKCAGVLALGAAYTLPTFPLLQWRTYRFRRQLHKEYPKLFTDRYKSMYSAFPETKKPPEVYAEDLLASA